MSSNHNNNAGKKQVSKNGNSDGKTNPPVPIPPPGALKGNSFVPIFLIDPKAPITAFDEVKYIESIAGDWQIKVRQISWSFFNFQFTHDEDLQQRLNRMNKNARSIRQLNPKVLSSLVKEYYSSSALTEMKRNFWRTAGKQIDKNEKKAEEHRLRGNQQFECGNFRLAINEYTLAAMYARDCSANCSKAFANRSAAFFHLGMYESCLVDIEQAFEANFHCPNRLYWRKAEALMHLNRNSEAHLVLLKNIDPQVDVARYKRMIKDIESKQAQVAPPKSSQPTDDLKVVERAQGFRFLKKVRMEKANSPTQPTRIIADEPIEMGECIFEEWSAERILYVHYEKWFCHQCMRRLRSDTGMVYDHYLEHVPTFVCKHCFNVLFCSRECRAEAMAKHHSFLCRFPNFNLDANYILGEERPMHDSYARIALRLLCSQNLRTLYEVARDFYNASGQPDLPLPVVKNAESAWILSTGDVNPHWRTIFALPLDYFDLDARIVNSYALTSGLALRMILEDHYLSPRLAEAFGLNWSNVTCSKSWLEFIGGLLLRLFLQFKQFTVFGHLKSTTDFIYRYRVEDLGRVVMPSLMRFRPSCRPNMEIASAANGELIRFHARIKIEPGHEITRTSDYEYPEKGFEERQLIFSLLFYRPCLCDWCSFEGRFLYLMNHAPPAKRRFAHYIPLLWHDHRITLGKDRFVCGCGCKDVLDAKHIKANMIKCIEALVSIGEGNRCYKQEEMEALLQPLASLVDLDGYPRLTNKVYPSLAMKHYNNRAFEDACYYMDKCLEGHFVQVGDGACLSTIAAASAFFFYFGVWCNGGAKSFHTGRQAAEYALERVERFCLVPSPESRTVNTNIFTDFWAPLRITLMFFCKSLDNPELFQANHPNVT